MLGLEEGKDATRERVKRSDGRRSAHLYRTRRVAEMEGKRRTGSRSGPKEGSETELLERELEAEASTRPWPSWLCRLVRRGPDPIEEKKK